MKMRRVLPRDGHSQVPRALGFIKIHIQRIVESPVHFVGHSFTTTEKKKRSKIDFRLASGR
jgi:hypothetical protein